MGLSGALRLQLTDLEIEHRELTEKLAGSEPRTLRLRLRDTRRFVEGRLSNLQSMWTGEARFIRAEIAKHVQKIALSPRGKIYVASGTWDLLGSVVGFMVPGDRLAHCSHGSITPQIAFRIEVAAQKLAAKIRGRHKCRLVATGRFERTTFGL